MALCITVCFLSHSSPPWAWCRCWRTLWSSMLTPSPSSPVSWFATERCRFQTVGIACVCTHTDAHTSAPASSSRSKRTLSCSRKDLIKFNILPPQEEHNKWKLTSRGRCHKHLFSLRDEREPEHLCGLLIVLGNSKQWGEGKTGALPKPPGDTVCLAEGFSRPGSSLPLKTQSRAGGWRRGCQQRGGPVETVRKTQQVLLCGRDLHLGRAQFLFWFFKRNEWQDFFGGGEFLDTSCVCDVLCCTKNLSRVYVHRFVVLRTGCCRKITSRLQEVSILILSY